MQPISSVRLALVSFGLACALPVFAQNVAIVNGQAIPKARLNALSEQLVKAGRPVTPEALVQLREEAIAREIFAQEAVKLGLQANEEFRQQMELARQTLLIRQLFAEQQARLKPTDADIKAEYDKFAKENQGQEYRTRHILVETEAQAKDLLAQLAKGASFEALAKKHSKDPGSGANGGDLDWATASTFVKPFSDAMVALKKGEVTPKPVQSQFGFHIIRLDDTRPIQMPKFEDVKEQLGQQMLQKRVNDYQEAIRAKAKVE
jgi:peptidyl-prolyl cis-trans isomerase C